MRYRPPPPPAAVKLIERLGYDHTLRLIETRGGERMWVPLGSGSSPRQSRADLEDLFGKAMATALIQAFGGDWLDVPLCRQWRAEIYHLDGLTLNQIARRLGVTRVTVLKYLNRDHSADRQTALPI